MGRTLDDAGALTGAWTPWVDVPEWFSWENQGAGMPRTSVILLIQDIHVRVANAATGELLRQLTIDPRRDYQPRGLPPGPSPKTKDARTHKS